MKISVFERLFNERILNKEVGLVLQKKDVQEAFRNFEQSNSSFDMWFSYWEKRKGYLSILKSQSRENQELERRLAKYKVKQKENENEIQTLREKIERARKILKGAV